MRASLGRCIPPTRDVGRSRSSGVCRRKAQAPCSGPSVGPCRTEPSSGDRTADGFPVGPIVVVALAALAVARR